VQQKIKEIKEHKKAPYVVHERDSMGGWERTTDSISFQHTFHRIFRFHPTFEETAERILAKLPLAFFGVHLRVESDWPLHYNMEKEFVKRLLRNNITGYASLPSPSSPLLLLALIAINKSA
jgi:hypothetical protein